jgi:hypothetical protein
MTAAYDAAAMNMDCDENAATGGSADGRNVAMPRTRRRRLPRDVSRQGYDGDAEMGSRSIWMTAPGRSGRGRGGYGTH